jgi:hypothetical protein
MTVVPIPVQNVKSDTWYYGVRCACMRTLALCEDLFSGKTQESAMHCSPAIVIACECGKVTRADRLYKFKTP